MMSFILCESSNPYNDSVVSEVPLADPQVILYNGTYYAYGTHSDYGIEVYSSSDLKTWKNMGLALNKVDSYADRWFWAPEVYHIGNLFYMYYSADEHICVATSDSPTGPFVQKSKSPMLSEKCIDSSLFIDDGKPYLFFVRFNDGNNIWVAQLANDYQTILQETIHPCIHVSQSWEQNQIPEGRVNEGPFVYKHNGIYYMTYSANHYMSRNYGIGVATANDVMGKWIKADYNPILQRPKSLVGTGHDALFLDKNGVLRIVFHAHHDSKTIHPRLMYIGEVHFTQTKSGIDKMEIGSDFIIPHL